MSLILEALRKSEAERQRGRAPGLFVEQVAPRPAARQRAPAWAWALGLLVVALLLVLGWREGSRQAAPADPATVDPVAAEVTQDAARRAELPTPAAATMPDPMSARDPASTPSTQATAPRPAPPAPVAVAPSAPSAPFAPPKASTPAPAVAASPMPAAPPPAPPAPTEVAPESLPTLGSLDAGTRAQLPPLKLSMHVFATEPAQRFVILDGRRLGEGANPSPGVVLEEIRRDGLVLSVNGQRLLLARP